MSKQKLSIHQKLSVLELVEKIGNVSQACQKSGVSRSQYYEYKRRFKSQGIHGLKDLPPIHRTHPQKTPPDIKASILELSLQHPLWGCGKLSKKLDLMGIYISSPTIQRILIQHDLGKKEDRIASLETKYRRQELSLSDEQIAAIEKYNPCFKERYISSSYPGEYLIQDYFRVGTFEHLGNIYLLLVVDTFTCYGFAYLTTQKNSEAPINLLQTEVLPFYNQLGLKVNYIETKKDKCFYGTNTHPYRLCLLFNNIILLLADAKKGGHNGFSQRFFDIIMQAYLSRAQHNKNYYCLEEMQRDLNTWLSHYNSTRVAEGFPNYGNSPMQMIKHYMSKVKSR